MFASRSIYHYHAVVSNPRNDGTRNGGTRNSETGFFFFSFKQKKNNNNNNKEKVNISHKIKSMHIFFILRCRSRARLSSLFRVRISRGSVTALRTCSPPIETMKRTKSKQVKKAVDKKKIEGPEKLLIS